MNEEFKSDERREQKLKEEFLDKSFKKAEVSRGVRPPDKKIPEKTSSHKNPFPKLGILLIIIAIIGLMVIHNTPYDVPWAYVKYDAGYGETDASIYKNVKEGDIEYQEKEITNLFSYIGITIDDFTDTPTSAYYGFISITILGIALIIFGILDKIRRFSRETFTIIHLIFATATIIPSTFIVLSVIKFIGTHLLLYYNMPFIFDPNFTLVIVLFPAAFILIVIGFVIIKVMFTIIKMNFNELEKRLKTDISKSEHSFSHSSYRGELQ